MTEDPRDQGCTLPPPGWWCSRTPGHDGSCAARRDASHLKARCRSCGAQPGPVSDNDPMNVRCDPCGGTQAFCDEGRCCPECNHPGHRCCWHEDHVCCADGHAEWAGGLRPVLVQQAHLSGESDLVEVRAQLGRVLILVAAWATASRKDAAADVVTALHGGQQWDALRETLGDDHPRARALADERDKHPTRGGI